MNSRVIGEDLIEIDGHAIMILSREYVADEVIKVV